MADLGQAKPSEPDSAGTTEHGRTALRVRRGAPVVWALPLFVLIALGVIWAVAIEPSWMAWLVLGATLVVVVGTIIALNPRRRSPAGGTRRR